MREIKIIIEVKTQDRHCEDSDDFTRKELAGFIYGDLIKSCILYEDEIQSINIIEKVQAEEIYQWTNK